MLLQYEEEEHAEKALNALNGRFYAGRLLMAEYSPVTDFRKNLPHITSVIALCYCVALVLFTHSLSPN